MNTTTTFDSTKESLLTFLTDIAQGKTQLPDFQRGWVWDDEHIVSLLASISQSFPIGAVMMLETGGDGVRFKPRLVEGVDGSNAAKRPERLILDGQQRLTSLFQALHSGHAVATKDVRGRAISRWYYIDIAKCLSANGDREETIVGLPDDRQRRDFRGEVTADYSTAEKQYAASLFPLARIFDCSDWRAGYNAHWNYAPDKVKLFDAFEKEIIKRFEQYQIPLILLKKETPKEAVCQVFEKVNTGGVSLSVFELLTATFAADDFNLRDDWTARHKRLTKHSVLGGIESTDFLQAVALLATRARREKARAEGVPESLAPGISCKRKEILQLDLAAYKAWADRATTGFEKAAKLLYSQKLFAARDLPYRTQVTPLAAIMATLGDQADNDGVRAKLVRWYWSGVFGELYGGAIETRFAKDLPEVLGWVDGGAEPATVVDANFAAGRLLTLRTRNSAAYKGLYALLLRDGGLDFRTGEAIDVQMYFDDKIDIHHIFPRDWCAKAKVDAARCDSIVNKTPLSARTNRMIGGNAPSVYLGRMQKSASIDESRMCEILQSHVIDPALLRSDDFESFWLKRADALLSRIERAMGKPLDRAPRPVEADVDEEDDREAPSE
jgi:hypothetical protein